METALPGTVPAPERNDEREYFAAVEEGFSRLRGRPLLLSPRDVARVKVWRSAGIPLRVVMRALERFFAREAGRTSPRRLAASLEYCERDVYELWEEWRLSQLGAASPEPGPAPGTAGEDGALRAHLERACEGLARARAGASAAGAGGLAGALGRARGRLERKLAAAATGDSLAIEEELAAAERRLVAAARAALAEAERRALTERVRREVDAIAGGMDETARAVLLRKAEERALLDRFAIPRLTRFAF